MQFSFIYQSLTKELIILLSAFRCVDLYLTTSPAKFTSSDKQYKPTEPLTAISCFRTCLKQLCNWENCQTREDPTRLLREILWANAMSRFVKLTAIAAGVSARVCARPPVHWGC